MQNDEKRIAVFIDFENVAMGVRESNYGDFDISLVLKRVVEKGKILVKRAYSDWHRYSEFKRSFHQVAIELIDVPQTRYSGKNSADIRMVVDALDLSYQKEHIDTFVLVSGDSDFSPLVSKLRENGRYVIGVGVKKSSSDLLVNNCDEFIYYEDLVRPASNAVSDEPKLRNLPEKRAEALRLVMETFDAMQREGKEDIYGSMVKQTLLRKLPSFNESYYGYPMFSRLLEDAAENKLLRLTKDQKSGGYILSPYSEASTALSAQASPTNEDSTKIAVQAVTRVEPGLSQGPSSGEPRERSRRSRWGGRGRMHGPQRRPEAVKADAGIASPVAPAPSTVVSTGSTESPIVSEAVAGALFNSGIVPAVAPMPETPAAVPPQPTAVDAPLSISPVAIDKGAQPGRRDRPIRWGRGRRGPGRSPARSPEGLPVSFRPTEDRQPVQPPPIEHAGFTVSEPGKIQPEPKTERALLSPEPQPILPHAPVGPVQPPATHEAGSAAPKGKRIPKPTQRVGKKDAPPKRSPPRKGPKK